MVVASRRGIALGTRARRGVPRKHLVSGLMGGSRFFRLRKSLEVSESRADGVWIERCHLLGIHAFGETREEAWQAFIELFEADWDLLAQEKDAKLSSGAQQLKRRYLELVESVELAL
jgi:hypothetical protein